MRKIGIIQARMGSSRLPGKMLMHLAGEPVIQWVYSRASLIEGLDGVVVATTTAKQDDELAHYCQICSIPVFRGSEDDVLDRYVQAARLQNADIVMRITGDCPLLDPVESAKVLKLFSETPDCDYSSNVMPPFLPDGLDTEVVRFSTLERIWQEVKDYAYREHVTYYIPTHPEEFRIVSVEEDYNYSNCRWTLDEQKDYELLTWVTEKLVATKCFGSLGEIVELLEQHPERLAMNNHIKRNEGLARTLKENPPED